MEVKVIGLLSTRVNQAGIGDVVTVSVQRAKPGGMVKKGEIHKAVIIRTKKGVKRKDGTVVRFNDNAVVLISKTTYEPIASRVFGPVTYELRKGTQRIKSKKKSNTAMKVYSSIISRALEVL